MFILLLIWDQKHSDRSLKEDAPLSSHHPLLFQERMLGLQQLRDIISSACPESVLQNFTKEASQ